MDTETDLKRPKERSSAYPSYTIQFSVELIKKIVAKFGASTFISREEISKKLNISESHLSTQLGACVHYGLLEMKTKVGYKPTDCYKRIVKFLTESEKQDALIEALNTPELYKKLLVDPDVMDDSITVEGLAIRLNRSHNITDQASEKAARIFLNNLADVGVGANPKQAINDDFENTNGAIQKFEIHEDAFPDKQNEDVGKVMVGSVPGSLTLEIPLKDQRIAKLIYPMDITDKDLDKIVKFVDALRE